MAETTGVALVLEEWCEGQLAPFARRIVNVLVGNGSPAPAPHSALEAALLQGLAVPVPHGELSSFSRAGTHQHVWAAKTASEQQTSGITTTSSSTDRELHQLRLDLEAVILQRAQLRAQLVVERDRREHAEAQLLVHRAPSTAWSANLGRCLAWEEDRQRHCLADQQLARTAGAQSIPMRQLGDGTPSSQQQRSLLQFGTAAELDSENVEVRRLLELWHDRHARPLALFSRCVTVLGAILRALPHPPTPA